MVQIPPSNSNRSSNPLDAKLHQGQDANVEHEAQSRLLGTVPYGTPREEQSLVGNIWNTLTQFVGGIFSGAAATSADAAAASTIPGASEAVEESASLADRSDVAAASSNAATDDARGNSPHAAQHAAGTATGAATPVTHLPEETGYRGHHGAQAHAVAPSHASVSAGQPLAEAIQTPTIDSLQENIPPTGGTIVVPPVSGGEQSPPPLIGDRETPIIDVNTGNGDVQIPPADIGGDIVAGNNGVTAPIEAGGEISTPPINPDTQPPSTGDTIEIPSVTVDSGISTGGLSGDPSDVPPIETGEELSAPVETSAITLTSPILSIAPLIGVEGEPVGLTIGLNAPDIANVSTTITISGLPDGATLSAGTENNDGTWSLNKEQLAGLTLTLPEYDSGTLALTVTATSSLGDMTSTATTNLTMNIEGVATAPLLSVQAATGIEDTAVALAIGAALPDMNGSEHLSVTVSGLPAGAALSAGAENGDGSWTLTSQQLAGLTLTPPEHYSGQFDLTVAATASENNTAASASATLPILIAGVALAPTLSAAPLNGVEDMTIPLVINAAPVDLDGSESVSVIISGLPVGASLSAGVDNEDGSWSLTSGQLAGLILTPPEHYSGEFNLMITATASENGTTANTSIQLPVNITGVANLPNLSVQAVAGVEGIPIPLPIAAAPITATTSEDGTSASVTANLPIAIAGVATAPELTALPVAGIENTAIPLTLGISLPDIGTESVNITVSGLPAGASLSAGTDNGDGSWALTSAQLSGLTLMPPEHYSGDLNLTVTATAFENDTSASATANLAVTVTGVATTPLLSIAPAIGAEDSAIPLSISASLADSSEQLAITVIGVPLDANLSDGTRHADGSWTLTPEQLDGLTLTPPANMSGALALTVIAASSENGMTATAITSLPVIVTPVADMPVLTAVSANGLEDTPIPLSIGAVLSGADQEGNVSVTITGLPQDASLSAGTHNADGSWTLTSQQLVGLTLTPPEHYSGSLDLTVTAASSVNGTAADASINLPVNVISVATAPELSLHAASDIEDVAIPLVLGVSLPDIGTESVSITVSGLPAGASLSAGTDNGDGSWMLTSQQLTGLTLTPPSHYSGEVNLTITATAVENGVSASTSAQLPISIIGVANLPNLVVAAAVGNEDSAIPLQLSAVLTDSSEHLSIVIGGVPDGATLSSGLYSGNGHWSLTPAQLQNLSITPPHNFNGILALTVTAVSTEDNGTSVQLTSPLAVTVLPIVDAPLLPIVSPLALVSHDAGIAPAGVNIAAVPIAASGGLLASGGLILPEDGVMVLSDAPQLLNLASGITALTFSGIPAGASLSAGTHNADGSWTLSPAQLMNLSLSLPSNSDQDFTIGVNATVETTTTLPLGGTTTVTSSVALATVPAHVVGLADQPALSVQAAVGDEGQAIPIAITTGFTDTDGSETLSVTLGLPTGFISNIGIDNHNGTWTIPTNQLGSLTVTPPAGFSGDANFTVTATSTESEGSASSVTTSGSLHVDPIAHAPEISATPLSGSEDQALPLNLSIDTATGGEHVSSITISGLPSGATLLGADDNHDGTWSVHPAQLGMVQIVPPLNWSGDATLSVTAVSQADGNDTQASATIAVPLHIEAVADAPQITATDVIGQQDSAIALHLGAEPATLSGSEHMSVVLSGVPDGAMLSAGLNNGDGSWTLHVEDLSNLTVKPPEHFTGDLHLSLDAYSVEASNGSTAEAHQDFTVHVTPAATGSDLDHTFQSQQTG